MEENVRKIRSIYAELQGYLNQAKSLESSHDRTQDECLWNQYNNALEELNKLTENSYARFRIEPRLQSGNVGQPFYYIKISTYRSYLGGIIAKLHSDYFIDEPAPFNTMSNMVFNTTQSQSQSVKIEIAIEMTELIARKVDKYKEGTPERNFLEQIKQGIKDGKNMTELIKLILETGTSLGLSLSAITQLLF